METSTNAKKLEAGSMSSSFYLESNPETDWKIIFISTLALIILTVALSVFAYIKVDKGEIFAAERSSDQKDRSLDLSSLRETVSYYEAKSLELETLRNTALVNLPDPSI